MKSVTSFFFCLNSSDTPLVAQLLQTFFGWLNRIIDRSYVGPLFTVLVPIVLQRVKKVVKCPKSNSPCLASSLDHSSSSSSSLILISTTIALCQAQYRAPKSSVFTNLAVTSSHVTAHDIAVVDSIAVAPIAVAVTFIVSNPKQVTKLFEEHNLFFCQREFHSSPEPVMYSKRDNMKDQR